MSQAAFRLVETTEMPETLRFERRSESRRRITGSATIICSREEDGQRHRKIISIQLRDIASQGLGATCREAMPVGAAIELLMPSHGLDLGFDLFGKIVRCEPCEEGYALGITLYQAATAVA